MKLPLATQRASWMNSWFIIYVYPTNGWHSTSGVIQLEKLEQNLFLNLVINNSLALEGIQVSLNSLGKVSAGDRLALDSCEPWQSVQLPIYPAIPRWVPGPNEKVNARVNIYGTLQMKFNNSNLKSFHFSI